MLFFKYYVNYSIYCYKFSFYNWNSYYNIVQYDSKQYQQRSQVPSSAPKLRSIDVLSPEYTRNHIRRNIWLCNILLLIKSWLNYFWISALSYEIWRGTICMSCLVYSLCINMMITFLIWSNFTYQTYWHGVPYIWAIHYQNTFITSVSPPHII